MRIEPQPLLRVDGHSTIHLYHGLITVQRIDVPRSCPTNIRRQIALAAERLPKNILRLWPRYAKSLWDTKAGIEDWAWFGRDLWSKAVATSFSGLAAPDASTDVCCVYTEADVAHAVQRYRVSPSSVAVVGNPDLALMGLSETDFGAALLNAHDKKPDVLYVDSALIEGGAVFDSAEDFIQHLVTTAESLARAGLRLVVKPHPVHFRSDVPERLRQHGDDLCTNTNFLDLLRTARGCIVEPSSAAVIPALCGAPMLLAQYGKLAQQDYGTVLTSYPRTRHPRPCHGQLLDDLKNSVDESAHGPDPVNGTAAVQRYAGSRRRVRASLVRRRAAPELTPSAEHRPLALAAPRSTVSVLKSSARRSDAVVHRFPHPVIISEPRSTTPSLSFHSRTCCDRLFQGRHDS